MQLLSKTLSLSTNQYSIMLMGFLFLIGSHLFDYYPWIFIIISLMIVDFKHAKRWETLLLFGFIISSIVTWYFLDPNIVFNSRLLGQFALIFIMYIVGLNIPITQNTTTVNIGKVFFYFLFIFFIGYMISIIYSYIFIIQDNPLSFLGMHVCFQNEYKRTQINGGLLISTIITYYLTFMANILPFILFYFKDFQKNGFHYLELLFLSGLSFFSIYLAAQMGRRTTIVLIIVILGYLSLSKIIEHRKQINFKIIFLITTLFAIIIGAGYYFLENTSVIHRLMYRGLHDQRFGFWVQGIQVMLDYPFGGGYDIVLSNFTKLAHNTWIDMGKDLGVIPFIFFLLLSLVFIYNIIRILFDKKINIFIKHTVMIISITLFTILMIEPVFNSDKTFFTYIMFLLGVVITLNNSDKSPKII